jgi:hypothetical protein
MKKTALETSELSYRRLIEAMQVGIIIFDAETGLITEVNSIPDQ